MWTSRRDKISSRGYEFYFSKRYREGAHIKYQRKISWAFGRVRKNSHFKYDGAFCSYQGLPSGETFYQRPNLLGVYQSLNDVGGGKYVALMLSNHPFSPKVGKKLRCTSEGHISWLQAHQKSSN